MLIDIIAVDKQHPLEHLVTFAGWSESSWSPTSRLYSAGQNLRGRTWHGGVRMYLFVEWFESPERIRFVNT